jgi:hypothetical protein
VSSADGNALTAFNAKFRAAAEEKDGREREAKASRKAAGKAALKKLLADRKGAVDARKAKNREDESANEQRMLDALQGETWSRVVSLIDVHGHGHGAAAGGDGAAAGGGKAGKHAHGHGGGHAAAAAPGSDTTRMKDVLIGLKTRPLPA